MTENTEICKCVVRGTIINTLHKGREKENQTSWPGFQGLLHSGTNVFLRPLPSPHKASSIPVTWDDMLWPQTKWPLNFRTSKPLVSSFHCLESPSLQHFLDVWLILTAPAQWSSALRTSQIPRLEFISPFLTHAFSYIYPLWSVLS